MAWIICQDVVVAIAEGATTSPVLIFSFGFGRSVLALPPLETTKKSAEGTHYGTVLRLLLTTHTERVLAVFAEKEVLVLVEAESAVLLYLKLWDLVFVCLVEFLHRFSLVTAFRASDRVTHTHGLCREAI